MLTLFRSAGRLIALAGLGVLVAVMPAGSAATNNQESWCTPPEPYVPGSWPRSIREARPRDDVEIRIIAPNALQRAMQRLSSRTIVPLDPASFRLMARDAGIPTGRYLYLMRAGVMTPVELSSRDFPDFAAGASFYASESVDSGRLHIGSLITSANRQQPRNYAVLASSTTPIDDVVVFCIGGR